MGNLDDYYARQESGGRGRAEELRVRQYNRWVDIVLEAVREFTRSAPSNPPHKCDWVLEGGELRASWELLREYDDTYRIHLMPDGRLVYVRPGGYATQDHPQITSTIHLRHISQQSEEHVVGVGWAAMSDLCSNVVTMGYGRFGLPTPSHLHDDLLAHWSRTHPADDQSKW